MNAYDTTNLIFKTRYPFAKCPSLQKVSRSWMIQFFLRKMLSNKGLLISIRHVYKETCNICDFAAPSFEILQKNMLKYKAIDNQFYNFIIYQSDVNFFDKSTFQNYNIENNMPMRNSNSLLNNNINNISKRKRISLDEKTTYFNRRLQQYQIIK